MQEESKEEYLARHRRELAGGGEPASENPQETEEEKIPFSARLKKWLLLLLFAAFIFGIYMLFGMLKAN
jgi:hypothetical protein